MSSENNVIVKKTSPLLLDLHTERNILLKQLLSQVVLLSSSYTYRNILY